jgi:hypothetical protein
MRMIALALLVTAAPLSAQRAAKSPEVSGACHSGLAEVALNTASNAVADRHARNVFRLPWTDTLPPMVVVDSATCARAAIAYEGQPLPPNVAPVAGVVRAGGLYFVFAANFKVAGEFTLVAILDGQFRVLEYLTT